MPADIWPTAKHHMECHSMSRISVRKMRFKECGRALRMALWRHEEKRVGFKEVYISAAADQLTALFYQRPGDGVITHIDDFL